MDRRSEPRRSLEEQHNRDTLAQLKTWLDNYRQKLWSELPEPWRLPHAQEKVTWGLEVNGLRLRARLNCNVWPQKLPQVITADAISKGGSIVFSARKSSNWKSMATGTRTIRRPYPQHVATGTLAKG